MAGLLEAVEHRLFGLPLGVSDAQAPLMQVKVVLVGAFSFDRHRFVNLHLQFSLVFGAHSVSFYHGQIVYVL